MCGIAGVFLHSPVPADQQLSVLLDAIRHRGYSDQETGSGPGWAIGAIRLQIVDPANGKQPFYSEDRTIAVVFNGEIYNHKELRKQLVARGYRFQTETDTEVIAHGYHFWRNGLFDRLDGMFAIVIHRTDGDFLAARDPMGVKPLYCAATPKGVFMASEIKALLHLNAEISELPPGHLLARSGHPTRYTTVPSVPISLDFDDNAKTLRQFFSEAVRKRVDTPLPVAVLLSGGIDSSAVMAEAVRYHPDVTGFTIGRDGSPDVLAAKKLAGELGFKLVHIRVTDQELLAVIPEVIWSIESFEPNHIRGGTLSYILAREISKAGFRVALCGEGADELFGGYREFGLALLDGESEATINALMNRFVAELHKTQLKRVDRTSMRFTLEVREPYLDKSLVALAGLIPLAHKLTRDADGSVRDKRILRAACHGLLPDWLLTRPKDVLSLGAGFGSNGPEGLFYDYGEYMVSATEFASLRGRHPEYGLRNREEAYYFKIFLRFFGELSQARQRPTVNATAAGA